MKLRSIFLKIIILLIIALNFQLISAKGNFNQPVSSKTLFPDEYSVLDSTSENVPKKTNWNIEKTLKSAKTDYYNAIESIQKGDTVKAAKFFETALSKLNPLASFPDIEDNIAYIELLQLVIDDYEQFIRTTEYIGENTPFYMISDLYFEEADKGEKKIPGKPESAENIIIVEPGYIAPPDSMTIDLTDNEFVKRNMEFLLNPKLGLKTVQKWFERSSRWFPMFKRVAAEEGVPEELIYVSLIESGLMPNAISRASAVGIWQFVRSTGEMYGLNAKPSIWVDERRDPEKSTKAALRHFRDLFIDFGDWHLALAAYNCGKGCVERAMANAETDSLTYWNIRPLLPKDTKNYIPSFIAVIRIFSNPKAFNINIDSLSYLEEYKYDVVHLDSAINISAIAKASNVTEDVIKELNPELIKSCTPPEGYDIKIPFGSINIFNINFKQISREEKTPFFQHEVVKNETVTKIAKMYGITRDELVGINKLKNYNAKLVVGTFLRIPVDHMKIVEEKPEPNTQDEEEDLSAKNKESLSHCVKKGETLFSISQKYGVNIDILKKLNKMNDEEVNSIQAGDSIIIAQRTTVDEAKLKKIPKPEKVTHKVRKGETLSQIASLYNVSIEDICDLNNIKDDVISIGQRLKIETNVKNTKQKEKPQNIVRTNAKGQIIHEVSRGETLSTIAQKYNISMTQLREMNPNEINGDDIKAGISIIVKDAPQDKKTSKNTKAKDITTEKNQKETKTKSEAAEKSTTKQTKVNEKTAIHTVQKGDSFYSIAEKYNTTVEDLQKLNPKISPEKIQIGQKIKVK
ncbi:MAG: LysM peptidoglycan-binding domain-containing protein [bacterium]